MKGISKEFFIGSVVVICIAILVVGMNYLKGINLFDRPQTYFATYMDVDALSESNPVLLNGYTVGLVHKIRMHPAGDGRVLVQVSINDNNLKVPLDSKLKIITSDFFGSKAIKIELGDSLIIAENKDTLAGVLELDLTKMIQKELEPLGAKVQTLISGVDAAVSSLNAVFADSATQGLPKTFGSLQKTMENLERTTLRLDGIVGDNGAKLNSIFSHVESITSNIKNNNEALAHAIQNLASFTDTLAQLKLASTIKKVDKAMGDFAQITEKINTGDGTLSMLINNDSLHNELTTAAHSLDLLIDDIQSHPRRYLHFSLIDRKDKEEFSKKELEQMRDQIDKAIKERESQGEN